MFIWYIVDKIDIIIIIIKEKVSGPMQELSSVSWTPTLLTKILAALPIHFRDVKYEVVTGF